jgi:hypothetical protein
MERTPPSDILPAIEPSLEDSSSGATDSGYNTAAVTPESGVPESCANSFADGIVLPGRRLFPSKVTKLKPFDQPIPQSTQNRFEDLNELFSKPLYNHLTKASVRYSGVSIKLKVLGENENAAKPWVVVQCDKALIKKVKQFFNQQAVKSQYQPPDADSSLPSFEIFVFARPPRQIASTNYADIYSRSDTASLLTLCGMTIKANKFDMDRVATIGGLIKVATSDKDFTLYGMTVCHIIPQGNPEEDLKMDCSSGEDNYEDDGYSLDEEEKFVLDLPSEENSVPEATDFTREVTSDRGRIKQLSVPWSNIGHISIISSSAQGDENNLDWALVEMDNPSLYRPNLLLPPHAAHDYHGNQGLKELTELQYAASKQTVVLSCGISGFKQGILSLSSSFLMLSPGKGFVKSYNLALSDGTGKIIIQYNSVSLSPVYSVESWRLRILGC